MSTAAAAASPHSVEARANPGHVPAGSAEYLIVCPQAFAHEFERLADHRRRAGVSAEVRTIEWVREAYAAGRDDAERLRAFLRDAHARSGTRWVLIGGSGEVMPIRIAWVDPVVLPPQQVPTDLYFACLDGDWDADGDGRFGEPGRVDAGGDQPDVEPELVVGRAPVADREQARRFVHRTLSVLRHERPGPGRDLVAAESGGPLAISDQVESGIVPLLLAQPGNAVTRLYETCPADPFGPRCPDGWSTLARASLFEAFAGGHRLWVLAGGGNRDSLQIASRDRAEFLASADLGQLEDGGHPGHVVLMSSTCGTFERANALGPAFVNAAHGGAVTVVGPSCLQFFSFELRFVRTFLDRLLAAGSMPIGEALQVARGEVGSLLSGSSALTVYGFNLLGDPMLTLPGVGTPIAGRRDRPRIEYDATRIASAGSPTPQLKAVPAVAREEIAFSWEPGRDAHGALDLAVFDVGGRRIREVLRAAAGGTTRTTWDLRDESGRPVPAGVYLVRLTDGVRRLSRRVVVMP